ncbi:MAG TPA: catalase, partial [Acetobacteraceae bacterium]|nr:catalase [Acetobacteraceae bacterium]
NFLRANLARHLAKAEARFEFMVQPRTDADAMPIEDPRVEWDEAASPFVPVAALTIPRQDFDTAERDAFGENLSFTPWHCLEAHRPLGGINRVRRTVYETISRLRHELNGAPREEPAATRDMQDAH